MTARRETGNVTARDIFHDAVKHALEKEGWLITHDPLSLQIGGVEMYIGLGAEQLIAAEKQGEKIASKSKALSLFLCSMNFISPLGHTVTISSHSYRKTQSGCSTWQSRKIPTTAFSHCNLSRMLSGITRCVIWCMMDKRR
jgi:hypothetical protein